MISFYDKFETCRGTTRAKIPLNALKPHVVTSPGRNLFSITISHFEQDDHDYRRQMLSTLSMKASIKTYLIVVWSTSPIATIL